MDALSLGVFASSRKPDERRLPIHPRHVERIDADLRERMFLERGYGERFGVGDDELAGLVGGLRSAGELVAECDVLLLPKPLAADLEGMREGQVLWGWPHCVQDSELTQRAIDARLTVIAWEVMNLWARDGSFDVHVFHKNNEMAGYASVLHALELRGTTGDYGGRLKAAVVSFGATGRGAVTGLSALGVHDVSVLTQRQSAAVVAPISTVEMSSFTDHDSIPEFLAGHDIVVNCVLQDTDDPLTYLGNEDLARFRAGSLFVDVSCDEGMGFEWARPTSFADPMFKVGEHWNYAVDHSPSHLWNSATWEISEALMPYLRVVMSGPAAWEAEETIRRAIEIRRGEIVNPKILSFQGRAAEYPHAQS
jgi:alanine dehydrogenase